MSSKWRYINELAAIPTPAGAIRTFRGILFATGGLSRINVKEDGIEVFRTFPHLQPALW